jgi:hypothetical protein
VPGVRRTKRIPQSWLPAKPKPRARADGRKHVAAGDCHGKETKTNGLTRSQMQEETNDKHAGSTGGRHREVRPWGRSDVM